MSNALISVHGVVRVELKRICLPSGSRVMELTVVDRDGGEATVNLFTGTADLEILGLETEGATA